MPQFTCRKCGNLLPEGQTVCPYCGTNNETNFGTDIAQSDPSVNNADQDNKNTFALVGMITGIVSVVLMPLMSCFCTPGNVVLGILPIVFGILGLNYIKDHPGAEGKVQSWVGIGLGAFTLLAGLILIVIMVIFMIASHSV
ncbi:MAG: zinc-ribbon domain-containing protein [Thermoguttaceae bacterium]|nr:zinc-ribbon domain-containing protein [Thermoguttaceae bacterium]